MSLVAAGLTLACGSAQAQTRAERPWSIGISPERQERAQSLYQEGNRDFTNGFFAAAVTKYQAALQHWSHPGIHYNLALALISLERPIEAYENIVAALSHGTDALHPEEYQRALDYKRLLRQQIAVIEVVCKEPGVAVTLDGKSLFTGPGRVTTRVLPGKHQLVASKVGYLTTSKAFTVAGAARAVVELPPPTVEQPSGRIQQRWPAWTHWTVAGLGIGAGATAVMLHWEVYNFHVEARDGWQRKAGLGALLVSGTALASLNRPQPGEDGRRWPGWTQWTVTGLGLGTGIAMLLWDVDADIRERKAEGQRQEGGREYGWQRKAGYVGYATAGALWLAGTVLASRNRPQFQKTAERPKAMQLSPGGPAGSAGISVHMPF